MASRGAFVQSANKTGGGLRVSVYPTVPRVAGLKGITENFIYKSVNGPGVFGLPLIVAYPMDGYYCIVLCHIK